MSPSGSGLESRPVLSSTRSLVAAGEGYAAIRQLSLF